METSFLYITKGYTFEEGKGKFARIQITAMELDKVSRNKNLYRFSERYEIARSIIGRKVRWGISRVGKHLKGLRTKVVGFVESTKVVGNKIRAVIKITDTDVISMLKSGIKRAFRFSVGGVAQTARLVQKAGKRFFELIGARVNHLQMWLSEKPRESGFESAKVEKVLEFSESALIVREGLSPSRLIAILVLTDLI